MRAKKTIYVLGAACMSLAVATAVFAQDDLNDLLDIGQEEAKKPAAKPAAAKPAADAKAAATKPVEAKKPEVKAAEPAKVAETKPVEAKKPEAKVAEPAKVAETKPVEAKKPEVKAAEPAKVAETKPVEVKKPSADDVDDVLGNEPEVKPDAAKVAEAKKAEAKAAETAKVAETKPVEAKKPSADNVDDVLGDEPEVKPDAAKVAEAKKAEAKAAETAKVAETKPVEVKKPEAKAAEPAKVAETKPVEVKKPEVKAAEPAKVADTKPVEAKKPEVKAAEPAKVADTKPVEAKKPDAKQALTDMDDLLKQVDDNEKPAVAVKAVEPVKKVEEPAKVADKEPAKVEVPAKVADKEPAKVEEPAKVADKEPAKVEEPVKVPAVKPVVVEKPHPEAALISELAAAEKLRREALDNQADSEIKRARAAYNARDWDEMFKQFQHALEHLNDRPDSAAKRLECHQGMAEAKYQAARQAIKENDRETALKLLDEAINQHHPLAAQVKQVLESQQTVETETDYSDIEHVRNKKEYKQSRDVINKRLRMSAQYLAVADLAKALEQCELVLRSDPYNQKAIALRDRIQRKRQLIIDKEREATRNGMIADVGAAWRPVYAVNSVELKSMDGGTTKTPVGGGERSIEQSIEKRMKDMKLPQISFRPPATIIDAVDYFRQASKDYDLPEIPADQRGFNFVLQLDKQLTAGGADAKGGKGKDDNAFSAASDDENAGTNDGVPQIPNIAASNISLWEALKLVCKISGFKFKVQGSVIMVMPKSMTTEELITRTYSVVESFVDRMNDASSGLKNAKSGEFGGGDDSKSDDSAKDADENQWKAYFEEMGVTWPNNSRIKYIKAVGKLRVTNTEDQLAILEDALTELNVTPSMIEIETRFVEVAQEDLNSLGFEWLLNTAYSFNIGGKIKKVLNLKDGVAQDTSGWQLVDGSMSETGSGSTTSSTSDATTKTAGGVSGGGTVWSPTNWTNERTVTSSDGTSNSVSQDSSKSYVWNEGAGWVASSDGKTGKNALINAVDGSTYSTGMRFLSTSGNHVSGEDLSTNDKFMRLNAFLGDADLSVILHMLSQRSDTDLLSAPKVVTKSGQEATIKVVTIYRYPTDYDVTIQSTSSSGSSYYSSGGSSGKILPMVEPQNFETQEVGVILTVTPDLSPEGLINLQLTPKIISEPEWRDYGMKVPMDAVTSNTSLVNVGNGVMSQIETGSSGDSDDTQWFTVPMEQPFFKERSVDTHVTLYNGATIVMGGLITEERRSMEDKIPFLGDIPFIGRLFRNRSEWSNKRNLLIFVTARLVDPNGRQIVPNTTDKETNKDSNKSDKPTPAPAAA